MSDENQETMTAAITTAVIDAIADRDRKEIERQQQVAASKLDMENAAKRFLSIRDIVMAVGFFAALIGGGTLTLSELQQKPSTAEMQQAINRRVDPIEDRVEPVERNVDALTGNVERMQQLQEMQMQHAEWRADVADCRARKSCKRAPSEPQSLKDKRRELMTNRAK